MRAGPSRKGSLPRKSSKEKEKKAVGPDSLPNAETARRLSAHFAPEGSPPHGGSETDKLYKTSTDALNLAQSIPLLSGEVVAESSVLHSRFTKRDMIRSHSRSPNMSPERSPGTSPSPRANGSPAPNPRENLSLLEPSKARLGRSSSQRNDAMLRSPGKHSDIMSTTGSRRQDPMASIDEHTETQLNEHRAHEVDTMLTIDQQQDELSSATSGACLRRSSCSLMSLLPFLRDCCWSRTHFPASSAQHVARKCCPFLHSELYPRTSASRL